MTTGNAHTPKLLLHIGTDKAGSTAIQSHLAVNRDWLARQGVYVPESGLGANNGHAALFQSGKSADWERLAAEIDASIAAGANQVLLSWEGLNFWSRAEIEALRAQLPGLPVTVVVYVREQAEIVQSGFLQEIKRLANTCPISTFQSRTLVLRLRQQRKARYPASRDYFRLARRWEKSMNAEICVRVFDRDQLVGEDVVTDFLNAI